MSKVAILINSLKIGGAEKQAINEAILYLKLGYNPVFFLLENDQTLAYTTPEVPVIYCSRTIPGIKSILKWIVLPFSAPKILKNISHHSISDIVVHCNRAAAAACIARIFRRNVHIHLILHSYPTENSWIFQLIYRFFLITVTRRFSSLHALSPALAREMTKKIFKQVIYIPPILTEFSKTASSTFFRKSKQNSLFALEELIKNKNKKFICFTCARLVPIKRIQDIISAIHAVNQSTKKNKPRCKLIIAGTGLCAGRLSELVNTLHCEDDIVFAGEVFFTAPLFINADTYICSSQREGLPLSILEALYHGCPIITSNASSAISELFSQKKTDIHYENYTETNSALIYEPCDVSGLKAALLRMRTDPKLRILLAKNGKKKAAQFSISSLKQDYSSLLQYS